MRKFKSETMTLTIMSYDKDRNEFETSIGRFDPFVSCHIKPEDAENWIGKTITIEGFFTGCFIPSGSEAIGFDALTNPDNAQEAR